MEYPKEVVTNYEKLKYDLFMQNFEYYSMEGLEWLADQTEESLDLTIGGGDNRAMDELEGQIEELENDIHFKDKDILNLERENESLIKQVEELTNKIELLEK